MSDGHSISIKSYFAIFMALLLLLVVTVAVAYFDFGKWNLVVAMAIASTKAFLIVLYFMHVKFSIRLIALLFGSSLYMLAIGAILMFSDYWFR